MAEYTTQVRTICESLTSNELGPYPDVAQTIEQARPLIFNFPYPIFDEEYRPVLETKILKHYYTREIGMETYGLWKLKLDTKLNEIMPYYNELYLTTKYQYNPLFDYEEWRTHVGNGSEDKSAQNSHEEATNTKVTHDIFGTKDTDFGGQDKVVGEQTGQDDVTGSSDTEAHNTSKVTSNGDSDTNTDHAYSDTPQSNIANVQDLKYLTAYDNTITRGITNNAQNTTADNIGSSSSDTHSDYTHNDNTTTTFGKTERTESSENGVNDTVGSLSGSGTESHTITSTNDYVEHVIGKSAAHTYPQLIMEYRNTLLNIDMLIIERLSDLFMLVY